MPQLAILSGIYAKETPDLARSVPVNLIPVAQPGDGSGTGVSKGYLRLAHGVRKVYDSQIDRGGAIYNGRHIRALGNELVEIKQSGIAVLGSIVTDGKPVTFAEGFGRLAVASAGALYYLTDVILTKVVDSDLGTVLSVTWQDGYFITTDGSALVVTELKDPTSVDPLKYGSSEADPDPVVGVLALRGELYALNRYTIEKFVNQGVTGFPFARSRGSQVPKGCVGPQAFTPFVETFAFCGSARNETPAIHLAGAGQAIRISPRELDEDLERLTNDQLASIEMEAMQTGGLSQLLVHLPTTTWVYHWSASQLLDVPVWSKLQGGAAASKPYVARHFTLIGTEWWCGTTDAIGVVDSSVATVFGQPVGFQFDTPLLYNEGRGAIINALEVIPLDGFGTATSVNVSYTDDGRTWSNERSFISGAVGERGKRMQWRRLGKFRRWRGFRFRGVANAPIGFTRLDADLEPLNG